MQLGGHLWTLQGHLGRLLRPPSGAAETWTTTLEDPVVGPVRLTGRLSRHPERETLLILVHGLGGCAASTYLGAAVAAAETRGLAHLRLNLRGADRSGEDYYHAGLSDDLHAAVASSALEPFRRIVVLGYSLGGHLALRFATEVRDPRVRAIAAVCSPLDLAPCAAAIDSPRGWLYRRYLLRHLLQIYAAVHHRRGGPVPLGEARRLRRIREFDERIIAPRHGFTGAGDYYRRASAGPRLGELRVPALLVASARDPMVPVESLCPFVEPPPPGLTARLLDAGGHVAFPADLDLDLGLDGAPGLEPQVLSWLLERA